MMIDTLLSNYKPTRFHSGTFYTSNINKNKYLNINTICAGRYPPQLWMKEKQIYNLLETTADIVLSCKNKGSWIHESIYKLFYEWFFTKTGLPLPSIADLFTDERIDDDIFFIRFD